MLRALIAHARRRTAIHRQRAEWLARRWPGLVCNNTPGTMQRSHGYADSVPRWRAPGFGMGRKASSTLAANLAGPWPGFATRRTAPYRDAQRARTCLAQWPVTPQFSVSTGSLTAMAALPMRVGGSPRLCLVPCPRRHPARHQPKIGVGRTISLIAYGMKPAPAPAPASASASASASACAAKPALVSLLASHVVPKPALFVVMNAGSVNSDAAECRAALEAVLHEANRQVETILVEDPQRMREIVAAAA